MIKQGYKRYLDPQSTEDVPRKTKYRRTKKYTKKRENIKVKLNFVQNKFHFQQFQFLYHFFI